MCFAQINAETCKAGPSSWAPLCRQILRDVNVETFGGVPFSSIYVLQVLVVFDFQKKLAVVYAYYCMLSFYWRRNRGGGGGHGASPPPPPPKKYF